MVTLMIKTIRMRRVKMSKMKNKYFDIIDRVPADKQARAYELQNLIEFTNWSIQADKSDLRSYIEEYNDLMGEGYEG